MTEHPSRAVPRDVLREVESTRVELAQGGNLACEVPVLMVFQASLLSLDVFGHSHLPLQEFMTMMAVAQREPFISRYRPLLELGRGGMARVYLAESCGLGHAS